MGYLFEVYLDLSHNELLVVFAYSQVAHYEESVSVKWKKIDFAYVLALSV